MIAEPTRTPWNSLHARLEALAGLPLTLCSEPAKRERRPLEGDVAAFHHQASPALGVEPAAPDCVNVRLRDPTGLGTSLSDVDRDPVVTGKVEHLA